MGVPSYFVWLVKKFEERILHPVEQVPLSNPPDNLFLDWNCGIHPSIKKVPLATLEANIDAVLTYLEEIYTLVNPRKLLYIAIDGVAPRAKMQQQRNRRFKSVQDAHYIRKLKEKHGIPTDGDSKWDYNMISPGTVFMDKLAQKIKERVSQWSPRCKVIVSDASIPGEGEHKIMKYIREETQVTDHHMVYGLDADLIFLSLINQPNITLLREKVEFGDKYAKTAASNSEWCLLSIDSLREIFLQIFNPYVSLRELETFKIFGSQALDDLTAPFYTDADFQDNAVKMLAEGFYTRPDIEGRNLIVDYIFMSFMMGNDFLPSVVSLQMKENGMDQMLRAYKMVQTKLHQYLINLEHGPMVFRINIPFFIRMLEILTAMEPRVLMQVTKNRWHRISNFEKSQKFQQATPYEQDLMTLDYTENKLPDYIQLGEPGWAARYYEVHFHLKDRNPHESHKYRMHIVEHYIRGMIWTLQYYLTGRPDWTWEYPFMSAPTVHDILDYMKNSNGNVSRIQRDLALAAGHISNTEHTTSHSSDSSYKICKTAPVSPLEQLLCILPPASSHLLPKPLAKLMDPHSYLAVYYPEDFALDIFGHRFRWESHALLPTIPAVEIRAAVIRELPYLQDEELRRNKPGEVSIFPAKS